MSLLVLDTFLGSLVYLIWYQVAIPAFLFDFYLIYLSPPSYLQPIIILCEIISYRKYIAGLCFLNPH